MIARRFLTSLKEPPAEGKLITHHFKKITLGLQGLGQSNGFFAGE